MKSIIKMATKLSPFVYWGQSKENISLKVDLRSVENAEVNLTEKGLQFSAQGQGIKGVNSYGFQLDFYLSVNPEKSRYRKTDLAVEFDIVKSVSETWPRLTADKAKLPWLKIDFDKFMLGDSEVESDSDTDSRNHSEKEILEKLNEDLSADYTDDTPSLTQIYLFIYNLFQFVGFTFIFIVLIYNFIVYGHSAKLGAYEAVGPQITLCQIVSILEVINPFFKLVKANSFFALIQVTGRNLVLFPLIMQEPKVQIAPLCWYLFVIWSAGDIVRYSYYMLRVVNIKWKYLTWLRYTIWMPLYPLGLLTEATIIFQSISYFSETGFLSITLPNSANFAFYFPYWLMVHLVILCIAGSNTIKYLMSQRRKQLSTKVTNAISKNKLS